MLNLCIRPWCWAALLYALCLTACDSSDDDTPDAAAVPGSGMDASLDASQPPIGDAADDRAHELEDASPDDAQPPNDAAESGDATMPVVTLDASPPECDPSACADGECSDSDGGDEIAPRPDGCFSRQRCIEGRCVDVCASTSWENEYSFEPDPQPEDAYCLVFFYDCGPEGIDYWHSVTTTRNECGTRGGIEPYEGDGTCGTTTAEFFDECGIELILE
jgi:hypothetical protein